MNNVFDIYRLSTKFYKDYPKKQFPEILVKQERPYNCIVFEIHKDYYVCIPYRTNIRHRNAYHFKSSVRSRKNHSGLDYTKLVVINDVEYLDKSPDPIVDHDEYLETVRNIKKIENEVLQYLDTYCQHHNKQKILHPREYNSNYGFTTLDYFQDLIL